MLKQHFPFDEFLSLFSWVWGARGSVWCSTIVPFYFYKPVIVNVKTSMFILHLSFIKQFHMVEATYRVKEARKQLYSKNGRHPDDEEVAEATGLSMKRLAAVLLTPKAPRSLEQKIGINQNLKPSVCNEFLLLSSFG